MQNVVSQNKASKSFIMHTQILPDISSTQNALQDDLKVRNTTWRTLPTHKALFTLSGFMIIRFLLFDDLIHFEQPTANYNFILFYVSNLHVPIKTTVVCFHCKSCLLDSCARCFTALNKIWNFLDVCNCNIVSLGYTFVRYFSKI